MEKVYSHRKRLFDKFNKLAFTNEHNFDPILKLRNLFEVNYCCEKSDMIFMQVGTLKAAMLSKDIYAG